MNDINSVLVIGGAGYIGSVLSPKLVDSSFDVKILDSGFFGLSGIEGLLDNSVQLFHGDIRNNNFLDETLKDVDCVIHLAAIVGDPLCKKNPMAARQINLESTQKLVELSRKNHVKRLIFASTCSNYGTSTKMVDESSELNSLSLYSETKVSSESIVLNNNDSDMNTTVLRFATAFGLSPRMRFDLLLQEFIRDAYVENKIVLYGPESWRPLVHVQDISNACIKAVQVENEKISGEIFNVGSNEGNFTKIQLAKLIQEHLPQTEIEIHPLQKDPRNYKVSFEKIKNLLHFEAKMSVKNGISEIITSIQEGKLNPQDSEFSNMSKMTEKIPVF